jgi:IS5 family transposase
MAKPHSLKYIKQLLEWGFDKEFIARDMGVNLASLEVRLNRAKKREQNGRARNKRKGSQRD